MYILLASSLDIPKKKKLKQGELSVLLYVINKKYQLNNNHNNR